MNVWSDPEFWQQVRHVFGLLLFSIALVSLLAGAIYFFRIPFNTVSGGRPKFFNLRACFSPDSFREWVLANPFNVVFYSDLLTPKGRRLRRRVVICYTIFIVCWGALFIVF